MQLAGIGALAAALALAATGAAAAHAGGDDGAKGLSRIGHIVVIYEENHSFDNLYGGWEGVDGLAGADASHTTQVSQAGDPFGCLPQNDVNLTSPPQPATCHDTMQAAPIHSTFPNAPFAIDDFIKPDATTCPKPGDFFPTGVPNGTGRPGGCTRDLVHRFYNEQFQIDGGRQDRYTLGSDAQGLTQGVYDTRALPIYQYLHQPGHPPYAIADNFFQAAFGGSFLNHQWLVAAATPVFANAVQDGLQNDLHSQVDSNGMPTSVLPFYTATGPVRDAQLTAKCTGLGKPGLLCGDYAINTTQPWDQPYQPGTADARRLPPLTNPTIGDRLSEKGVDWAWYSGGWSNANGNVGEPGWTNGTGPACSDPATLSTAKYPNCPDKLFQFHHQPLAYFKSFGAGTAARAAHLRDEQEFLGLGKDSGRRCMLKPVSFVKPIGAENEHPGYASAHSGSSHLVDLLQSIQGGRCAKDTMIVVTYDEFGGQWDHVPPPGQAGGPDGPSDLNGPGTRIPALVVSPGLERDFGVDHTSHDTTSVLSTIEERFELQPLSDRDAQAASLASVFRAGRDGLGDDEGDDPGHDRGRSRSRVRR